MSWHKILGRLSLYVQTAPVVLPVGVAVFGVVAMIFLVAGNFDSIAVWVLGLEAAWVAAQFTHRRVLRTERGAQNGHKLLIDSLVLLGVVLWVACSLPFTYQHVRTDRDPATYNVTAVWLTEHNNLHIPVPASYQSLNLPDLTPTSLGFLASPDNPDELSAQGSHLLPALLGLAGRIVGVAAMLHLNVLFGAAALLALYGFGRTIMKPGWAALATVTLSFSLPMLYFSRDTYTEPLTLMCIFGGLSLLHYAVKGRSETGLWFLAGILFGTAVLARIDGYLPIIGVLLFSITWLAYAKPAERRGLMKGVLLLLLGLLLTSLLAWQDLTHLSEVYYQGQRPRILEELWGIAALVPLGLLAIFCSWRTPLLRWLDTTTRRWREPFLRVVIPTIFLVLLSRPLWYVGYKADHTRTFSEQTMNWVWWYLGPVAFVVGVVGLTAAIVRVVRGKERSLLAFLWIFATSAALYVIYPNITGDQPWATRRFLPVILPGFALLAMLGCAWLAAQRRWRRRNITFNLRTVAAIIATLGVVGPLFVSYPFTLRRLYVPQLAQIDAVCASVLPGDSVLWLGSAGQFMSQTVRSVCSNDSFGVGTAVADQAATVQLLQTVAARNSAGQGTPIVVGIFGDEAHLLPKTERPQFFSISSTYADIDHSYKRAPRNTFLTTQTVLLARLQPDGTLAHL